MVSYCCAYNCYEKGTKGSPYSFHSFPRDEKRRKEWEKSLRRANFKATDATKICSKHFEQDCFDKEKFGGTWLKSDAIPTIFDFPDHLSNKTIKRKPSKRLEGLNEPTSSLLASSFEEKKKRKYFLGDFKEEDMESPSEARRFFELANQQQNVKSATIKRLKRVNFRLAKKVASIQSLLQGIQNKRLITESAKSILESSGTASKEEDKKKDHIPLEPTIEIKEEPLDYNPTPSTSTDTTNEEFILPHEENAWTPPVPAPLETVVEPQFTLSVASLAVPNDPENPDGEQVKKKRKTNTSTFVPSTNGSEMRPLSPVYNLSESSNPGSSKDLRKDQFDVFGEYIAAKLRSLDRRSCAHAQKAIGDIIFEAEMGKFLDGDCDSKDLKNCAS